MEIYLKFVRISTEFEPDVVCSIIIDSEINTSEV